MKRLKISADLSLPLEAVTQTFAILAKRRVGKTYTASVMAEEFVAADLPFVALDPTGAWWGLRSSADGKKAGLPVVIFGGAHGDVPLEPGSGKELADVVVDHPGFYVIDMSQTASNAEQDRIATDFAERLYRRKAKSTDPLHLFVDEADSFIPQRPGDGQLRMLGAYEALVRRGGIRGIGMTMITQRPAVINKNVLSQAEVLIAMQITSPHDRDAIDYWVKGNGTKEQRDQLVDSLASMKKGDAWIWSPGWLEEFKRIHIRERRTFNSSATPEVGEQRIVPSALAPVNLDALRDRIAESIDRAKADDPKELRAQISQLKSALAAAQGKGPVQVVDKAAIDRAVAAAVKQAVSDHVREIVQLRGKMTKVGRAASEITQLSSLEGSAEPRVVSQPAPMITPPPPPPRPRRESNSPAPTGDLGGPDQRILDAIAWCEMIGSVQPDQAAVAFLAGYSGPENSAYKNPRARLNQRGLVEYAAGGRIALTDAGRGLARYPEQPGTKQELHSRVLSKLGGPESRILIPLLSSYPEGITNDALSVEAGYSGADNSAYKNPRARLRTFGLIEYLSGSIVRAADLLFPEGLE